jgi:cell division septum initiation protein DivIVA
VMADSIDELVKDIAAKHGVAVGRDDPIMILQTVNARLLEDSAKAQQAMLERFKEELEALSARWSSDAKEKAERVLNAALAASGDTMRERARETAALMRAELDSALNRIAVSLRQARMVGILNVVASCITLLAAAVAMATVFGAVMH